MNYAKLSDEALEKKLANFEKRKKVIDICIFVIIGISVLLFILDGFNTASLPLSSAALLLLARFYFLPNNIGNIKTELNSRNTKRQDDEPLT